MNNVGMWRWRSYQLDDGCRVEGADSLSRWLMTETEAFLDMKKAIAATAFSAPPEVDVTVTLAKCGATVGFSYVCAEGGKRKQTTRQFFMEQARMFRVEVEKRFSVEYEVEATDLEDALAQAKTLADHDNTFTDPEHLDAVDAKCAGNEKGEVVA